MDSLSILDLALAVVLLLLFSTSYFLVFREKITASVLLAVNGLFLLFAWWRTTPSSIIPGVGDDTYYWNWGATIATAISGEDTDYGRQIWPGKGVWSVIIALTHLLVSEAVFLPLAIAVLATVATALVLQRATVKIIGHPSKMFLWVALLLQPAFLGWGLTLNREAFFWLGTSFLILGFACFFRQQYAQATIWGFIGSLVTVGIRWEMGIPLSYLFFCAALYSFLVRNRPIRGTVGTTELANIFFLWSGVTLLSTFGMLVARNPALLLSNTELDPVRLDSVGVATGLEAISTRGAELRDYLSREEVTTAFQVSDDPILAVLTGSLRTMFGPFPPEIELSTTWVPLSIGTLNFVVTLALAAFFVMSRNQQSTELQGLVIASICVVIIVGFSITNYGMISRFRFVAQLLLLPVAAGGFAALQRWARRSMIRQT